MARPSIAERVSSKKPPSFRLSVWMATWTSCSSATLSALSITAGVAPQSSCTLSAQAPATTCSLIASGRLPLPLAMMPRLTGRVSADWSSRAMLYGPGVQVVPLEPSVGPVPPPMRVVMPLLSACSACCGAIRWTWVSMAPAVAIRCSPAMASVPGPMTRSGSTLFCVCGLPDLPMPTMKPSLMPMSHLTTPTTGSMTTTLVMTVSRAPWAEVACGSEAMPSRMVLPPP
ncbi:hypothetical protein SGRI78S_01931 [Streptomyces griseus subsp. griseus]